ncbi:MAG: hypothetical protein HY553_10560 [Elusimicrobia bacterium]|nr:hypothetical protein [Elusimicrobiota bacterium]
MPAELARRLVGVAAAFASLLAGNASAQGLSEAPKAKGAALGEAQAAASCESPGADPAEPCRGPSSLRDAPAEALLAAPPTEPAVLAASLRRAVRLATDGSTLLGDFRAPEPLDPDPAPVPRRAEGAAKAHDREPASPAVAPEVRVVMDRFLNDPTLPRTVAGFVQSLPEEYRRNYIFMARSESVQPGTPASPRILTRSEDSRTIVSFNLTDPNVELVHFNGRDWEFHRLELTRPRPTFLAHPAFCQACHGRRPNWDAYDSWAGQLPFHRDRVYEGSEEEKALKRLFGQQPTHPILRSLILPEGVRVLRKGRGEPPRYEVEIDYRSQEPEYTEDTPAGKVRRGGRYLVLGPRESGGKGDGQAVVMFDQLTSMNARRVALDLKESPNFPRVRWVTRAILLGHVRDEGDLRRYVPAAVLRQNERQFGRPYAVLLEETRRARRSLPALKADLQRKALEALLQANAQAEGRRLSRAQLAHRVEQELRRRNPEQNRLDTTGAVVDREDYRADVKIALLRFVLEPEGVRMDQWSMSSASRSRTYTFGDLFVQYERALSGMLPPGADPAQLERESLAAFRDHRRRP